MRQLRRHQRLQLTIFLTPCGLTSGQAVGLPFFFVSASFAGPWRQKPYYASTSKMTSSSTGVPRAIRYFGGGSLHAPPDAPTHSGSFPLRRKLRTAERRTFPH